jgi:hypothetical protein
MGVAANMVMARGAHLGGKAIVSDEDGSAQWHSINDESGSGQRQALMASGREEIGEVLLNLKMKDASVALTMNKGGVAVEIRNPMRSAWLWPLNLDNKLWRRRKWLGDSMWWKVAWGKDLALGCSVAFYTEAREGEIETVAWNTIVRNGKRGSGAATEEGGLAGDTRPGTVETGGTAWGGR